MTANPVKRMAEASNIPVLQPHSINAPDAMESLAALEPDLIVVVAFGQILRKPVLDLPPFGCVNVHASLLPRWRGAAPIPATILAGDRISGVTIMKMDAGLDTGPILAQKEIDLEEDETTATLTPRMAEMGAQLLIHILPDYLDENLTLKPQPEKGSTYAPQLSKSDGLIDWNQPVDRIDRQVRALNPWPGAFTFWNGLRLKVLELLPFVEWQGDQIPGQVFEGQASPMVATGEGAAWLMRLQLEGKKAMPSKAFLQGQQDFIGSKLES
ncbi:MAG: methionyl-tRNA formyltransferase, partial [Anaerolineales bacterium]|nr:methionyl-tRNA formyltransferase [Anaerolineales bacterium]